MAAAAAAAAGTDSGVEQWVALMTSELSLMGACMAGAGILMMWPAALTIWVSDFCNVAVIAHTLA